MTKRAMSSMNMTNGRVDFIIGRSKVWPPTTAMLGLPSLLMTDALESEVHPVS